MYYSRRQRRREKLKQLSRKMHAAKERGRMEGGDGGQPFFTPPKLRRTVIVIDRDFGLRVNVYRLERTNRVDCYWPHRNGAQLGRRMGWSAVLEQVRKDHVRVMSDRNL